MAGEQWITPSETRDAENHLVDVVCDGSTCVAEAVVPEMVKGGAMNGMDKSVAGRCNFGAVEGG